MNFPAWGHTPDGHAFEIGQRVKRLITCLGHTATMLPIYTRFQTAEKYLTVPVVSVMLLQDEILNVRTADGSVLSISLESLLDIVAFCDAAGKPVFLSDFSTGGDIAAECQADAEKANMQAFRLLIKHQHEYQPLGPLCPKRDGEGLISMRGGKTTTSNTKECTIQHEAA